MTSKADRLLIEVQARISVARRYACTAESKRVSFPNSSVKHEFDLFAVGRIVGGVTTSPLSTSKGNSNTGGRDRACSELLWLSLWPGPEQRLHVLTDRPLADWLVNRFQGVPFPHEIVILHYDLSEDILHDVGTIGAQPSRIAGPCSH